MLSKAVANLIFTFGLWATFLPAYCVETNTVGRVLVVEHPDAIRSFTPQPEPVQKMLRDGLLNGEIFYTLREAQIVIKSWRRHYNTIRPHASLGYKPPAPQVFIPTFAAWPPALRRPASPATLAQRPALN